MVERRTASRRTYTQEEAEDLVKRRLDDYVQHQVVDQLKGRLDASNHLREIIVDRLDTQEKRLDAIDGQLRLGTQLVAARQQFWESMTGRLVAGAGVLYALADTLHTLGIIR